MKIFIKSLWLSCILLLAGCINTPLPDYYVLTPEGDAAVPQQVQRITSDVALGVGPVTIPQTINRPNIVTPLDSNQLEVAEYHRWSEPLVDNISRVVITNLASRTGLNKLYAYPWLGNAVDYQIRIDVLQMIGSPSEQVRFQVRWQILNGNKPADLLVTRISDYRETIGADGYSAMVAAYSRMIGRLSEEIAAALSAMEYSQRNT
ncbi:MAG: PqiC family protein [Pseudomonadota bacterium]